jgi:condensin complex subunit 3
MPTRSGGERCLVLFVSVFGFLFVAPDCGKGEMVSQEALPQSLVSKCLDVMRNLASGERDLIRVIVEVIQELRDTGETEKEEGVSTTSILLSQTNKTQSQIEHDNATTQMSDSPRIVHTQRATPVRELSEEEQRRSSVVDLRCLDLCHGMLERVNGVCAAKVGASASSVLTH